MFHYIVVELLTFAGNMRLGCAFGVERISQDTPYICFDGVRHFFSTTLHADWERVTDRPTGAIQLLVGSEVASYLPEKLETVDNLVVQKSDFGRGSLMGWNFLRRNSASGNLGSSPRPSSTATGS